MTGLVVNLTVLETKTFAELHKVEKALDRGRSSVNAKGPVAAAGLLVNANEEIEPLGVYGVDGIQMDREFVYGWEFIKDGLHDLEVVLNCCRDEVVFRA